jgi:hypothetical protein
MVDNLRHISSSGIGLLVKHSWSRARAEQEQTISLSELKYNEFSFKVSPFLDIVTYFS